MKDKWSHFWSKVYNLAQILASYSIMFLQYRVFILLCSVLTHWGWVTHICISKLTINDSDNGLLSGLCQTIIWTNAEILLVVPLGTKFSKILIAIYMFSFKKMHLKLSSGKWRPFSLSLNVFKLLVQKMEYFLGNWLNIMAADWHGRKNHLPTTSWY